MTREEMLARLIAQASYETGLPVIFGVLTTDTIEQAIERRLRGAYLQPDTAMPIYQAK